MKGTKVYNFSDWEPDVGRCDIKDIIGSLTLKQIADDFNYCETLGKFIDDEIRKNLRAAFEDFSDGEWWPHEKGFKWSGTNYHGDDPAIIQISPELIHQAFRDLLKDQGSEGIQTVISLAEEWRETMNTIIDEAHAALKSVAV